MINVINKIVASILENNNGEGEAQIGYAAQYLTELGQLRDADRYTRMEVIGRQGRALEEALKCGHWTNAAGHCMAVAAGCVLQAKADRDWSRDQELKRQDRELAKIEERTARLFEEDREEIADSAMGRNL